MKQDLEERASTFDVEDWWKHRELSLNEMAAANTVSATASKAVTLYNPYEGNPCGRQLGETVEEFLTRLPPATTRASLQLPWIYIANPYRKAPSAIKSEANKEEVTAEGPPEEASDWAKFAVLAGNLLEELMGIKREIEKKNVGKAKSTITRQFNIQKEKIVKKILDTATELHCTSGKVCSLQFMDELLLIRTSGCYSASEKKSMLYGQLLLVVQQTMISELQQRLPPMAGTTDKHGSSVSTPRTFRI